MAGGEIHIASTKEIFLWRLSYAVFWSVLLQIIFLWFYLCVIYIDIFHPLAWIQSTLVLLSLGTWLRLIPCGCVLFLQGVYCGKDYLHPQPTYSTRFSSYCHLFSIHNIFLCSLHTISGGLTVWLYLSLLGSHSAGLFKSCPDQGDSWCLVEGNLFLFLGGFCNGFVYFFINHAYAPAIVNFPPIQQAKFIQVKSSLTVMFKRAMKDSLLPLTISALSYYVFRSIIRKTIIYLFNIEVLDDVSSYFYITNPSVLFYSWLFSSLFLTTMYSMKMLFNVYLTENNYFPIEPREGVVTLSAALVEGSELLNKLAAQDLMVMAYKDRMRRNILFSLSQPGGHPTNWRNISKQCLLIIDTYCKDLNAVFGDKAIETSPKNVFKPNLITSPDPIRSPRMRNMAEPYSLNPNEDVVKPEPILLVIKNEIKILLNALSKKPFFSFFFGELTEIRLKWIVLRGQTVSRIAQGLAQLVATSINEDVYGVVQDDLAAVVTSLLLLKQALDKLSKSGLANKKSLQKDVLVIQMLAELKSAVKRSIYKITITFGKYLKDLPLDGDIVQGLQAFIAMKEG